MLRKVEKIIFYLFIFSLPFQTRVILKFWGGAFNEWQAVFLYGTDILLILLFLLWGKGGKLNIPRASRDALLFIFLAITALSITQASNKILGLYRLIKIFEFVGLYYYIRSSLGKVFTLNGAFWAIIISGFFQGLMAIEQSILQHSLGLKWLGESVLRPNFSGVAVVPTAMGQFLRVYGTTPHPNVLSAWLFLGIFAFYFCYLYCPGAEIAPRRVERLALFTVYPVLLWGFLATFSRVAIGLWVIGVLARLLVVVIKRKNYNFSSVFKKRLLLLFLVTIVVLGAFSFAYWPQVHSRVFISSQEQAVSQRILYTKMAGQIASLHPWLGVGLGQFIDALKSSFKNYPDYFYQPVHNIFFLILDETGLLGLGFFVAWLVFLSRDYYRQTRFKKLYHLSFFIVFSSVLVMSLFDHFPWSLQQGQLIFWMTAGLISTSSKLEKVI